MSRSLSELRTAIAQIDTEVCALNAAKVSQKEADDLRAAAEDLETSCDGLQEEVQTILAEAEEEKETDEKDSEL